MANGVLTVSGPGLSREFVYRNTLIGRAYSNVAIATVLADLHAIPGTGWAAGTVDALGNVTARFDGVPIQSAQGKLADVCDAHIRYSPTTRSYDFGLFGVASGVALINAAAIGPRASLNPNIGFIQKLSILDESAASVNRIVPYGAGEGNNAWTLKYSTRSIAGGFPYDIASATGPDGQLYYYLQDAAAITALGGSPRGIREKVVVFKDVAPIANSVLAFELASNALYDLAATALGRGGPQVTYAVQATKLEGSSFKVGDTIRLLFNGVVQEDSGKRSWKSVDANVVVLERKRTFTPASEPKWDLVVSTLGKWRETEMTTIVGAIETLQAFKTAVKPYTATMMAGPTRESIEFSSSKWFALKIVYRANIQGILQAYLNAQLKPLKSNTTGASSGGGTTSSGGTSHSHSVSGGTSAGGSSHDHSVSGGTSGSGGGSSPTTYGVVLTATIPHPTHEHIWATFIGGSTTGTLGRFTDHLGQDVDLAGYGASQLYTEDPTGTAAVASALHTHTVDTPSHTHTFSGTTSGAEASHTHTFSGTTSGTEASHTHTISAHTHALTYGIFESSLPAAAAVQVWINGTNRTAALGGPWNADFSVDVTAYLCDGSGRPLWGTNTVEFRKPTTSPDAIDIIADVQSLAITTGLLPA